MNAFSAMLGTLFRDPNMSVGATYTPAGGAPVSIRVVYTQATDAVAGGGALMGTTAQQDAAEILRSDVPDQPTKGATLVLDTGQSFRLNSLAQPARKGLTWRAVLTNG